jgi:protein-arginine deiminase
MRVAPILTHHHAQTADLVFVTREEDGDVQQTAFVQQIVEQSRNSDIAQGVFKLDAHGDVWTRDFFEPGYSTIPGPDGPVGIRVMIRSAQPRRKAGRAVFEHLRSAGVGANQHFTRINPFEEDTLDSTGNHEAVPPYRNNGVSYPAGRIILGSWKISKPRMIPF